MSRSTPRGHTDDSREILMALTSRTSLEAVHDSGLIEREGPAHIGCNGDCAEQGDCTCSHAMAWRAPRQPRKPEPHTPNLPRLTQLKISDWRHGVASALLYVLLALSVIGGLYAVSEVVAQAIVLTWPAR